jgi:hypothetical protein
MVKLYRAMCDAELGELLATGIFRAAPGAIEGKWFAESVYDAAIWGDYFESVTGIKNDRIVEVELGEEIAESLFRIPRLDGVGPARFATVEQLAGATIREVQIP